MIQAIIEQYSIAPVNDTLAIVTVETQPEVIKACEVVSLTMADGSGAGYIEAGEIINGNKAIYMKDGKAFLASSTNPECHNKIIGVSKNAVTAGEVVNFKSAGTLNGFGGLVQNKLYYLGVNGDLSPTAPALGIFQIIGIAKTNEELFIDISIPIQRI